MEEKIKKSFASSPRPTVIFNHDPHVGLNNLAFQLTDDLLKKMLLSNHEHNDEQS